MGTPYTDAPDDNDDTTNMTTMMMTVTISRPKMMRPVATMAAARTKTATITQ